MFRSPFQSAARALAVCSLVLGACTTTVNNTTNNNGGGVAAAGELLFAPIRRTAWANCSNTLIGPCEIVPAALGDDAGIYGGAGLIYDALESAFDDAPQHGDPDLPGPRRPQRRPGDRPLFLRLRRAEPLAGGAGGGDRGRLGVAGFGNSFEGIWR